MIINLVVLFPLCTDSGFHYVAAGKPSQAVWDDFPLFECMDDSADQASIDTDPDGSCWLFTGGDTDITVTCCELDGSGAERNTNGLDCHSPANYDEAVSYCEGAGMRLCTLDEMLDELTGWTGCGFDCKYNWVSTECNVTTAAPSASPSEIVDGQSQCTGGTVHTCCLNEGELKCWGRGLF